MAHDITLSRLDADVRQPQVTLISQAPTLTPGKFNPKVGKTLEGQVKAAGIDLHLGTSLDTGDKVTGPIPETTFDLPGGGTVTGECRCGSGVPL